MEMNKKYFHYNRSLLDAKLATINKNLLIGNQENALKDIELMFYFQYFKKSMWINKTNACVKPTQDIQDCLIDYFSCNGINIKKLIDLLCPCGVGYDIIENEDPEKCTLISY